MSGHRTEVAGPYSLTKHCQYDAKPGAPDPIFAKQMQEPIGGRQHAALLLNPGQRKMPVEHQAVSVSVVIPALNEERHLGHLLSDIRHQTRKPQAVIVVDAGSHDRMVAVAEGFTSVRVLHGGRPVARGRNLSGRSASGDVVVFLDADTRMPDRFLGRFIEDFWRRGLDIACPLYAPHDSTPTVEAFHRIFNLATRSFAGVLPQGRTSAWPSGATSSGGATGSTRR